MRTGLMMTLFGAVCFAVGSVLLPWQTFSLAGVSASAFELGWGGALAAGAALVAAGLAGWGLATGRRAKAAAWGIGLALVALAWIVVSRVDWAQGLTLMEHEESTLGVGFAVGLFGVMAMMGGALLTRVTLPTWDASTPLVRVLALRRGQVVGERVLYEPQRLSLQEIAGVAGHVAVTREGDVEVVGSGRMTRNGRDEHGAARMTVGDRVVLQAEGLADAANTEVLVHHLAPLAGRTPSPLLARSEVWAFGGLATLMATTAVAAPVLGWRVEAKRELVCEAGRCGGVLAQVEVEEVVELDALMPEPEPSSEEPEQTSSKAAGGPEGTFGDPLVREPVVSKVPQRDGPLVERVDVRKLGVVGLLSDAKLADSTALAEVLRGDLAATSSKLAAAMSGSDGELVLGRGTNGLSWQGDGEGGPGDGTGRLMAQGDIDTGGPGIKTQLGKPDKRKVGDLAFGPPTSSGYCKASAIASVVNRRKGAIKACYEKSLQVKAGLQGKVSVRWTIDLEGKVQSVSATGDTLGDAATTQCILGWVRRMTFEKPEGGMCVVQWPFVFSNR